MRMQQKDKRAWEFITEMSHSSEILNHNAWQGLNKATIIYNNNNYNYNYNNNSIAAVQYHNYNMSEI